MEERRKFVRLNARLPVACVVLPDAGAQPVTTRDVSGGGARLFVERELGPGTSLQVALELPGLERPVHALGEVVWSETSETAAAGERQRSIEAGIRWSEISPQDRDALAALVASRLSSPGAA
jgi:hypothetical protein